MMEALDLSTSDDNRQEDLAASLLKIYEAMRVSGADRIPPVAPSRDWQPEARETADALLGSPLGDWARKFLALQGPVSEKHLEVLGEFQVNLIKMRHPAAKRMKQELKPALESQWLAELVRRLAGLACLGTGTHRCGLSGSQT